MIRPYSHVLLVAGLVMAWGPLANSEDPARIEALPALGYDALLRLGKLPLLADWPAHQDSSYSRSDDNRDEGNFLRIEKNGEQVMVDTDGPGVIYRIWSTGVVDRQMSEKCRFLFYFDGEAKPRLDLSVPELFGSRGSKYPFVSPLSVTFESGAAGNKGEGPCNLSYVPIPFRKHIKITGRNIAYYHVDYHKLPASTELPSWTQAWADGQKEKHGQAAELFEKVGQAPKPPIETTTVQSPPAALKPGQTAHLEVGGPGVISTLRVKLAKPTPKMLRGVLLRVTFDDAPGPSVWTPIGDFFGTGCGDRRFRTLACGMTDEGNYSYWPMPFGKKAVVAIENDTLDPVTLERFAVTSYLDKERARNTGYFHAQYVQDKDCAFRKDYTILKVERQRGKFVGVNCTMQNARGGTGIFFLEGDEKIYCDGEKWPSRWLGTGTEDYYNGAYFWNHPNKPAMVRPLGGLTFLDWGIGRVCAYRWHIPDCINFKHSIRVDQEHGPVSDIPTNYQSVAYYYLDKPTAQKPLPLLQDRLPVTPLPPAPKFMCCELKGDLTRQGKPVLRRSFHEADSEFEAGADVQHFAPASVGDIIEGTVAVPGEDVFKVTLFLSGGPDYGTVDVLLDGQKLGTANAYRPEFKPWLSFPLNLPSLPGGALRLKGGNHQLQLTITGKNPDASAAHLGFVALQLQPTSALIKTWNVIGTWPCPKDGGWAKVNPPETDQDLKAGYEVPGRDKLNWKPVDAERVHFGGDWSVAYGLTYVWSPDERTVGCFLGKDDALKVWVNDRVVFDLWGWSHLIPDSFFCSVSLKKGWNKLLIKNANWTGGFGYCVRIGDPDKVLKFARRAE